MKMSKFKINIKFIYFLLGLSHLNIIKSAMFLKAMIIISYGFAILTIIMQLSALFLFLKVKNQLPKRPKNPPVANWKKYLNIAADLSIITICFKYHLTLLGSLLIICLILSRVLVHQMNSNRL